MEALHELTLELISLYGIYYKINEYIFRLTQLDEFYSSCFITSSFILI